MSWIIYLLAALAGAANAFQSGAHGQLRKSLEQPVISAIVVYLSGLLLILFVQLFSREPLPAVSKITATPWWAWLGGVISVAATMSALLLAQRLGSGVFTGLSVTATVLMSVVLDHFGLIGFNIHRLTMPRFLGCTLMVAGIWLVAKF